jgi:hypothetical protein
LLGLDHHPRGRLLSEEPVCVKQLAATQQRRSQRLHPCHAISRQIYTLKSQQDIRLIERTGRSLRKSRQRRGQLKTYLAGSKRRTTNMRSGDLNPHKHWLAQTRSLHQLSSAYTHKPNHKPPVAPQSGPRPGTWICCACRQTNNSALCPTRCPLDGHYKCARCYVYPRHQPQPRSRRSE